jgi:hypothetical protein
MLLNQTHQAKVQTHIATTYIEAVYRLIINQILFVACAASSTSHIWHFYDALLYIVQFSGNVIE